MTDFDNMLKDSASVFMDAFGKSALAVYKPKDRASIPDVKVIYDPETIAFDPLTGGNNDIPAFIQIEAADMPNKARHKDRIEFEGMTFEVKQWEGEEGGIAILSVRRLSC